MQVMEEKKIKGIILPDGTIAMVSLPSDENVIREYVEKELGYDTTGIAIRIDGERAILYRTDAVFG